MFGTVADKYLEWAKCKTRGGADDRSRYENHIKDRFAQKRMNEITSFDLERMKASQAKEGLSPATIKHCLALIRQIFNKAKVWGLYKGENPVKGVKMPVLQNERQRFLTYAYAEADLLLKELRKNLRTKKHKDLDDPVVHDMALVSLHTGARAGEIFGLKGQDVNFDTGMIAFVDTKNTMTRYGHMTEAVREILKKRMPEKPQDLVFTRHDGLKVSAVSNSFDRAVDRLGLNEGVVDPRQKVTFHTLRHTFASWLALQGESLVTIREMMGHKSFEMTKRYAHLIPDHKRVASANLEKRFREATAGPQKADDNVVPITAGGNENPS